MANNKVTFDNKKIIKLIITFIIVYFILLGLLTATACIPKTAIKDNMAESAEYLSDRFSYFNILKNKRSSRVDRYADSILLNIAYNYDADKPLESIIWSSYYTDDDLWESQSLKESIAKDKEPNMQYLRYWHGSNFFVRSFHLFMNIKQIFIFHGVLLGLLLAILCFVLCRKNYYNLAIANVIAAIAVSLWFVPISLEYTWMFLVMYISSIVTVVIADHRKYELLPYVFLVTGMIASFLDFLSTETITLVVPLVLYMKIWSKKEYNLSLKTQIVESVKSSIIWGIGFVGMWIMKWLTATVVLRQNVLPYISEHIEQRTLGGVTDSYLYALVYVLYTNIKLLFPLEFGLFGLIFAFVCLMVYLYIAYVYHKKKISWKHILFYSVLGVVCYVRYLVMLNHSILHHFFTYRAQYMTIMIAIILLDEFVDWKLLRK